jgi:LysM repeat protein
VTSKKNNPVKAPPAKTNSTTANFKSRIKTSPHGKHYIVIESGDTLYNISEKSHVSSTKLVKINHLKTDYVPLDTKFFLD